VRITTLGYSEECVTYVISFLTVTPCTVAVTKFVDFTWSYIKDCFQNAEYSTIFDDLIYLWFKDKLDKEKDVVRGQWQGQGLINWFSGFSGTRTFNTRRYAAFTPAQLVARNKLRATRNLLRWCKRGSTHVPHIIATLWQNIMSVLECVLIVFYLCVSICILLH